MKSKHTSEQLRSILFKSLEALADTSKDVDIKRAEVLNQTAQTIINSAKVDVDYVKAIGGTITLPYVENQDGVEERPYRQSEGPPHTAPTEEVPDAELLSATDRTADALNAGPASDHPWRGLGNRVHRIEH